MGQVQGQSNHLSRLLPLLWLQPVNVLLVLHNLRLVQEDVEVGLCAASSLCDQSTVVLPCRLLLRVVHAKGNVLSPAVLTNPRLPPLVLAGDASVLGLAPGEGTGLPANVSHK